MIGLQTSRHERGQVMCQVNDLAHDLTPAEQLLESREQFGMNFGLERMGKLTTLLDSPQLRYGTIHVVGSNGKTSTAMMVAAVLRAHGLKVGTYTSPHLKSFTERVTIDLEPISEDSFLAVLEKVERKAQLLDAERSGDDQVTQYELLTAAAFLVFREEGVDVAVVEAGLGGRLDATNVLDSRVQVLTSVTLEHTQWLGNTLREIAVEKLAVVPDGGTLVSGELPSEAMVVAERVVERGARHVWAQPGDVFELAAIGSFQRHNFSLARTAAEVYLGKLDESAVLTAASLLIVPGRFEIVDDKPLTIFDGAHNPDGVETLVRELKSFVQRPRVCVLSILSDKDATEMVRVLHDHFDELILTESSSDRALHTEQLAVVDKSDAVQMANPQEALTHARSIAGQKGLVVATGSLTLIGDLS